MRRVTEYLGADHTRLHALLSASYEGGAFDGAPFADFRKGLLRHIGIEEKILLPAARRARHGEAIARARELRIEHGALTSLLVPTPDAAICRELASLLETHDAREEGEDGVYAECEALFAPAESQALAAAAEAFAEIPVMPHFDGHGVHRTAESALAASRGSKRATHRESP